MFPAAIEQGTNVSEREASPVDVSDVLRSRRSVRAYAPRDISDELVLELLDLARHAPSSLDGQPWQFIVVRDSEAKRRLATLKNQYCPPEKRHYPADFLADAPVVIVVCVDLDAAFGRHLEDGVLAAYSIMLGATRHGLTSVYLSASAPGAPQLADEIRSLFAIPA